MLKKVEEYLDSSLMLVKTKENSIKKILLIID